MALVNIRVLEGPSGVRHYDDAEERLASLMRECGTSLFNFLLVLTRERELALDCLQDAYARAYENLRRGKSVNQQWLYRVARNRAIDDFRRQRQVRTNVPEMEEIPMPEQGGNPRVRGVLAPYVRHATAPTGENKCRRRDHDAEQCRGEKSDCRNGKGHEGKRWPSGAMGDLEAGTGVAGG